MTNKSNEKTFLLGVGAQKAGTSWLHEQLHQRRDADFGFCKEYHILDALTLDDFQSFRPKHPSPLKWRTWRRKRFLNKPDRYFNYFSSLLKRDSIRLSGDITPSYGCLSASTLQWVRDEFAQRGVSTRIVFLMRDPVERILSQQRMQLRKRGDLNPAQEVNHLRKAAIKLKHSPSRRSNYLQTLETLEAVFQPKEVFIDLYERLFTTPVYERLCAHLQIPYRVPDWGNRVNQSQSTTTIPDDILQLIGTSQITIFDGVRKKCPNLDLQRYWPTASRWCVGHQSA